MPVIAPLPLNGGQWGICGLLQQLPPLPQQAHTPRTGGVAQSRAGRVCNLVLPNSKALPRRTTPPQAKCN